MEQYIGEKVIGNVVENQMKGIKQKYRQARGSKYANI